MKVTKYHSNRYFERSCAIRQLCIPSYSHEELFPELHPEERED